MLGALPLIRAAAAAKSDKPNVVYIFADQHRAASFPGAPHTSVIAPRMEQMGREGMVFRNAISNYPVCSPYRAMLMSGLAPFKTGMIDNRILLRENGRSLGNIFQSAGYRTGYVGKWHLGGITERARPGAHGFEFFKPWEGTGQHLKSRYWDLDKEAYVLSTAYNATTMTEQALEFIERRKQHPFLLMLSWNPPHSNYFDAPPRYRDMYKDGEIALRPNARGKPDPRFSMWLRNKVTFDKIHRGYLAHVSAIDHELGRVLDRLEELGLSEKTIVIYTSDHGDMAGSHGRGGKRQPFEESIRVPLVVRWKGHITPGLRPKTLIGAIDLLPTIAGLAGVPIPASHDGHNLSPLLRGEKIKEPEYQPIMHIFSGLAGAPNHPAELFRGVRTSRFTYAAAVAEDFVLFDLEKDPYQMHNLIHESAYASDLRQLQSLTQKWMTEWQDPFHLPRAARQFVSASWN